MNDHLGPRLELALAAAKEAGRLTLEHYQHRDLQTEAKRDGTPVTIADRQAELHLRRRIEQAFPQDGILGEEFGERPGDSGYRWILDPIDGTRAFVCGVPLYGTLVGVQHVAGDGHCPIGVIHMPAMGETVYAARGRGCWWEREGQRPAPARVSRVPRLADGVFCTTDGMLFDRTGLWAGYERLCRAAGVSRGWSDCYAFLLVATGRADACVEPVVALWDIAAIQPVIEEAGGRFTDLEGRPTVQTTRVVATNGLVHDEVLRLVRE